MKAPQFTNGELAMLWEAITQFCDNAAEDDETGEVILNPTALSAREKLDAAFAALSVAP